jgi:hypothetical protein
MLDRKEMPAALPHHDNFRILHKFQLGRCRYTKREEESQGELTAESASCANFTILFNHCSILQVFGFPASKEYRSRVWSASPIMQEHRNDRPQRIRRID